MKSLFKRLLSIIAAVTMVLGISAGSAVPALADENEKITISVKSQTQTDQNNTNEEYLAYQIFTATKTGETVGDTTSTPTENQTATEGVSYFLATGSPWAGIVSNSDVTAYLNFTKASDGTGWTVTWNTKTATNTDGKEYNETNAKALADILNGLITVNRTDGSITSITVKGNSSATAQTLTANTHYWSLTPAQAASVPIGYYLITSSLGSNLILATTDIQITEKNDYPSVDKKITQTSDETTAFNPAVSSTDAQIGDIITFTIDVKIPASANQAITVVDIISDGLTMNTTTTANNNSIAGLDNPLMTATVVKGNNEATFTAPDGTFSEWTKVSDQTYQYTTMWSELDGSKPVKVDAGGTSNASGTYTKYSQVIPAEIVKAVAATATSTTPATLKLTYKAKVNDSAALATATSNNANTNKAHIEYSNYTSTDVETTVYTHEFDLVKYYENASASNAKTLLKGAEFKLYRDTQVDSTTGKLINNASALKFTQNSGTNAYRVVDGLTSNEGSETLKSPDGKYNIEGLDAGDYYLEETKAPDGYNKLQYMIKITVSEATSQNNNVTTVTGTNVKASTAASESDGNITYTMASTDTTGVATYDTNNTNVYTSGGVAVLNQAGTVLPSTGGIGTTIFYVLGGVLVLGAVVLLVARRRKNA